MPLFMLYGFPYVSTGLTDFVFIIISNLNILTHLTKMLALEPGNRF